MEGHTLKSIALMMDANFSGAEIATLFAAEVWCFFSRGKTCGAIGSPGLGSSNADGRGEF